MKANSHFKVAFTACQKSGRALLGPWSGDLMRLQDAAFPSPKEILSGEGARLRGGRWNRKHHNRAVYGSTDPTTAMSEATAWSKKSGLPFRAPQIYVAIELNLQEIIDLTDPKVRRILGVTLKDIRDDDWWTSQSKGKESLCQALGRAIFTFGAEALLAPSSAAKGGINVVYFPQNRKPGSRVAIYQEDALKNILKQRKK